MTPRQRLAEVIMFTLRERKFALHYVASRCRVSIQDVERWRDGLTVPGSNEWEQLRRKVCNDFGRYTGLWQEARAEQDAERKLAADAMKRGQMSTNTNNGIGSQSVARLVNMGAKLAERIAERNEATGSAQPTPDSAQRPEQALIASDRTATAHLGVPPRGIASDGRLLQPVRPNGSMRGGSRAERRAFAKGLLLQRPGIKSVGGDGLVEAVRSRFGIGIDPGVIHELRAEIQHEAREAELRAQLPIPTAAAAAPATLPAVTGPVAQQTSDPKAIAKAIEIILGALPGLESLMITVDENGEASVDYQIREIKVQTTGGSLKVRR